MLIMRSGEEEVRTETSPRTKGIPSAMDAGGGLGWGGVMVRLYGNLDPSHGRRLGQFGMM